MLQGIQGQCHFTGKFYLFIFKKKNFKCESVFLLQLNLGFKRSNAGSAQTVAECTSFLLYHSFMWGHRSMLIPFYMCFVNLKNTYDHGPCHLLWEVVQSI